jgi:enoyl-CoA hydratase/carnithine racemase
VPINRLGLVMAYDEIAGLAGLVGRAAALEILLEGRVFGAQEAKDKGLVTRVVPDAEVAREAMATAGRIAEGAPLVARWHKKFLRRLDDPAPLTSAERDEGFACFDTEDFRIGYRSFLAKTKPEFKGR